MTQFEYIAAAAVIVALLAVSHFEARRADRLEVECDEIADERDTAERRVVSLRGQLYDARRCAADGAAADGAAVTGDTEFDHRAAFVRRLNAQRRAAEDAAAVRTHLDREDQP